jgi:ssDNA-binding replication factor A large subunit
MSQVQYTCADIAIKYNELFGESAMAIGATTNGVDGARSVYVPQHVNRVATGDAAKIARVIRKMAGSVAVDIWEDGTTKNDDSGEVFDVYRVRAR